MSFPLIALLTILILFIIFFVYGEPLINKYKIKNNNEYGSGRFATKSEIKKNFNKANISNIKRVGIPIYYSKDFKKVWFDNETPHYVYLGSSGSGKSVTAVIPTVTFLANAKEKRSIFITDPKGEIYHHTSKMLKEKGYNILTIDFREPQLSNHINILEPIICEYEKYIEYEDLSNKTEQQEENLNYKNISLSHYAEANRLISSIATMVMQEEIPGKDPFWNNSAKNLLEGLIGFFLEEYKDGKITREQITMTSIRKFQNSTMEEKNSRFFKSYIERKKYGSKSKDSLMPILSTSDNTYRSITGVFSEKMAIFDDINVANITSKSDFKLDILGREPTTLFVIVPDEDKVYYTLVTLIVGLLYRELVKLANKEKTKKLPIQMDWLMDEFANCPPLSDIESIVSVSRSRGMRFHFFIQSFAQLDNVYGKEVAQIILDNSGIQYLKTNTMSTAEEISKRLGKKTIESSSLSQSFSISNYNGNHSTSLMARDVMTPDEVKNLHYKTIIFPNIGFPIFRDTVIYKNLSCYLSGEIIRKVRPLEDLKDTYFTVENITNNKNRDINLNDDEWFSEFKKYEVEKLKPAIDVIKDILKDKIKTIDFKENNNRTYAVCISSKKITQKENAYIKGKINKNTYYINVDSTKNLIEIHLNNLIEINNVMDQEVIENNVFTE